MVQIAEAVRPDRIVHLGDHLSDGETLHYAYPDLPFVGVPGNCDGWTSAPEERLITLEGRRLLLGHGHHWGVKLSPAGAARAGRMAGAELVLFGHTHRPLLRREEDGLLLLNPGSVRDGGRYALLELEQGREPVCRLCAL